MTANILKELQGILPPGVYSIVAESMPDKVSEAKAREIVRRIASEYNEMKVEAGESVGLVAAESIGEPGTQMSVDYAEKVIIKAEQGVKAVEIGRFVDAAMAFYGFRELANHEQTSVCQLADNVFVPSLGKDEKIVWRRITAVSRHTTPSRLLRITTASGRQIAATPYHSFVIRDDNKVKPVAGSSLKVGDRIPALRKLAIARSKNLLAIEEFLPKERYVYGSELKKAVESNSRLHRAATIPLKYEQINNYANSANQVLVQEGFV
ncbi:hypothetical protein HYU20_00430, partial [Candidatus Woesearchaeota archaeon]|nr:hypothetical protein [Candidatus Woesearchaeota archaeon]